MEYSIIGALILFVLIGIIFRKSINLFIVRSFYGIYSRNYILLYKKYSRRRPHPYCFKDDFYYHVLSISNALKTEKIYETDRIFQFDHLDFTKVLKDTFQENGKPDCYTISEDEGLDLKVAGYKSRMFHSNEKTLLYHSNSNYFMGEFVFSSITDETSQQLIELIKDRFHPEVEHAKNFSIKDKLGNYIYFTDTGFFLSLKFFNAHNNEVKDLLDFMELNSNGKKAPLDGIKHLNGKKH